MLWYQRRYLLVGQTDYPNLRQWPLVGRDYKADAVGTLLFYRPTGPWRHTVACGHITSHREKWTGFKRLTQQRICTTGALQYKNLRDLEYRKGVDV